MNNLKINYKLQDRFDFGIFIPTVLLIIIGLMAIYSSTVNHPTASGNFQKQLISAFIALFIFFVIYFLPQQTIKIFAIPAYAASIFLLVVVLFAGKTVFGSKSWLSMGPLGFQPSEFAKLGTILMLAYWFTYRNRDINNVKDIAISLCIGFLPVFLILLEPDTGTAIVFAIITVAMMFWAGLSLFSLFVVLSPGVVIFTSLFGTKALLIILILIAIALFFFKKDLFNSITVFIINLASAFLFDFVYRLMKPHQQRRIDAFLDPSADPLGSGYNALQAKVAIGSGGLSGKGYLQGSQTQLRFIPAQWTDFIYSVIGEEFGFIGSLIVLILFVIIFIRLLNLSSLAKDQFSGLVIIGVLAFLFAHFAVNIGMNVGITPVVGLPLPFLSFGGSSLIVNMMVIGIMLNIYRNRKTHT